MHQAKSALILDSGPHAELRQLTPQVATSAFLFHPEATQTAASEPRQADRQGWGQTRIYEVRSLCVSSPRELSAPKLS